MLVSVRVAVVLAVDVDKGAQVVQDVASFCSLASRGQLFAHLATQHRHTWQLQGPILEHPPLAHRHLRQQVHKDAGSLAVGAHKHLGFVGVSACAQLARRGQRASAPRGVGSSI